MLEGPPVSQHALDGATHEPDELCCAVCMQLLCEPVKWPAVQPSSCTHAFCRLCTYQVMRWNLCKANSTADLQPRCPICRAPATDDTIYASPESLAVDGSIQQRVRQACAADSLVEAEYQARKRANHAEMERMAALEFDVPLHSVGSFQLRKGLGRKRGQCHAYPGSPAAVPGRSAAVSGRTAAVSTLHTY